MFKGKKKQKKDYPPRAGAMYRAKSGKGTRYYKLALQVDVLEKLEPDEKGRIHLVGFENDYKEKNSHPDVFFQPSVPKGDGEKSSGFKKKKRFSDDEDEAPKKRRDEDEEESSEEEDDEIPF